MAPEQSEQLGLATERLDRFLAENPSPTPFVVLDLDVVRACHQALRQALPSADIYNAVKANPAPKSSPPLRLWVPTSTGDRHLLGPGDPDGAPLFRQYDQARKRDRPSQTQKFHSTLRAAWLRPKQTNLVPDKGQFRSRFHHPLRYCCPATIFRDPRNRHRHHLSAMLLDGRAGSPIKGGSLAFPPSA